MECYGQQLKTTKLVYRTFHKNIHINILHNRH